MAQHNKMSYEAAGVSIAANDALVQRIQEILHKTHDQRVIANPNGFAGLFRLMGQSRSYADPVLIACSDGVGSKLLLASELKRLDSIGIDLVAMNVNDLITAGATPLFFLDYIAVHKNDPATVATLIEGIAGGCQQAGCALLGGETAEMPDLYAEGGVELAGFAVGVVEQQDLITGNAAKDGDILIGLASSGLHSNGYTLVRRVFETTDPENLAQCPDGLDGTLADELLKPTTIYAQPILALVAKRPTVIKGMAHITGGGLPGNVSRCLPAGCDAEIYKDRWEIPAIFQLIQARGVAQDEMYRVFNMGIGMVLVVRDEDAQAVMRHFRDRDVPSCAIGRLTRGQQQVHLR